jgi:ABC-type sugar transport system ATPase subunit
MGIDIRDPDQPVGTLSGGERQSAAIARAVHFGARVLILDEPTSALGVKQAGVVLRYVAQARDRGVGVVLITHNPHHAHPVGDGFLVLNRGRSLGSFAKNEVSRDELTRLMAGGRSSTNSPTRSSDQRPEVGCHPYGGPFLELARPIVDLSLRGQRSPDDLGGCVGCAACCLCDHR